MGPTAKARITLYETAAGGRRGPTPSKKHGCLLSFGKEFYFDVWMMLDQIGPMAPGNTYTDVPLEFLNPTSVQQFLTIGAMFELREKYKIGYGEIIEVI